MRYARLLLVILVAIASLMALTVAGLFFWVTPERITARTQALLAEHLGMTVSITEPITLQRLPRLRITCKNGTVTFPSAPDAGGRFESAVIELNPFAVFARNPRVDSVTLTAPFLTLPEGLPTLPGNSNTPAFFDINTFTVTHGELETTFNGQPLRISGIDAALTELNENGAGITGTAQLTLTGNSANVIVASRLNFGSPDHTLAAEGLRFQATGMIAGQAFTAEGAADRLQFGKEVLTAIRPALTYSTDNGFTLQTNAETLQWSGGVLSTPMLNASLIRPENGANGTVSLRAPFSWNPSQAQLSLTELRGESSLVKSDGTRNRSGTFTGDIRLNGTTGTFRLDGVVAGTPIKTDLTLNNTCERPMLSGSVETGRFDLMTLLAAYTPSENALSFETSVSLKTGAEIPALGVEGVSGTLTAKDQIITLTNGTITIARTELPLKLKATADGNWEASSVWQGVTLSSSQLAKAVTGISSGRWMAQGQLGNPDTLKATATLTVESGALFGADLPAVARIMERERPESVPEEAFSPSSVSDFSILRLQIDYANKIWDIKEGNASGYGWDLTFSGPLTALGAEVRYNDRLGLEFALPADIRLSGDNRPVWTPDWSTARENVVARIGEPDWSPEYIKERILRGVEDLKKELPDLPSIEIPDWVPFFGTQPEKPATQTQDPV